jgi:hypothetical protein
MTRSRDVADTQDNLGGAVAPWVGAKNFLINGSMDISQRGTTFTGVNSVYTLDRWYYASFGTSTTANVSQGSTDSVPGIQYYARVAANSATLSNYNFTQTIETANTIPLRGKTVTVSFWMRTPVAFSNVFVWNLRYSTSADTRISNAGTGTAVGSDFTFTGPTAWTKYSQTVTIPSDASSLGFVMGTYNNTVATAYFDITGVQLELGSQATPFARSGGSIGGELALCQRYYYRWTPGNNFSQACLTIARGSTLSDGNLPAPVTMRNTPTSIDSSNLLIALFAGGSSSAVTSVVLNQPGANSLAFTITTTGSLGAAGAAMQVLANATTAAFLGFSAEL